LSGNLNADKRQPTEELPRQGRKNVLRRRVIMEGIDDLWQADLVEMISYELYNESYRFRLTVIDTFSKQAWGVAIKKKGESVTKSMKSIFGDT